MPLPTMSWTAGLGLHLGSLRQRKPEELATGDSFVGNVIVDETATIGSNCKIGPNVSIGALCKIGDGVRLSNCVLLHRVEVHVLMFSAATMPFLLHYQACRMLICSAVLQAQR